MVQAEQPLSAGSSDARPNSDDAIAIWRAGVAAVEGAAAVRTTLEREQGRAFDAALAVGKAASAMLRGAMDFLPAAAPVLMVTKTGHADPGLEQDPRVRVIEAGHPVPDENSLVAGDAAIEFVEACAPASRLLVLVSGGASALVEKPGPGLDLEVLRRLSDTLLADGYSIDQINHIRIAISRIKGGRLLRRFPGSEVLVLGLSDIPGDDASLIGSGIGAMSPPRVQPFEIPGWIRELMDDISGDENAVGSEGQAFRFRSVLVGSNRAARDAAMEAARGFGLAVIDSAERLEGDVVPLAERLAERIIDGGAGVYLWGGEPTVRLPRNPGRGGRNQSLALALSIALRHQVGIAGVVAGTDGTDGPTAAAGGIVGPVTDLQTAETALSHADAGSWLDAHDRLLITGPTGTNVMDLAVLIKQ